MIKYGNSKYPTHCEHDELSIHGINPEEISEEDIRELKVLGIEVEIEGVYNEEYECESDESKIYSYRYGSC